MGRAIVRNPQVFLFDEPLSNLDAKLRVQMRAEIKELHQRLKVTTVYVTHDQIEAMTMADKIVVMNGGNVEQIGAPLELYDRPANLFVAGFIGSPAMNMMRGRISGNGFRSADGTQWPLPARNGHAPAEGEAVYGIRPEHLAPGPRRPPRHRAGGRAHRLGDAGAAPGRRSPRLIGAFRERVSARPGDTLPISPEPRLAHLFDGSTGDRI